MPSDTSLPIVIGISSRALFQLQDENSIFEQEGVEAYRQDQLDAEESLLEPNSAFPLVQGLLNLNDASSKPLVEVVIISHNSAELSLRFFRLIEDHSLDIRRAAFTSGASIGLFLEAFGVDLFLSREAASVKERALKHRVSLSLVTEGVSIKYAGQAHYADLSVKSELIPTEAAALFDAKAAGIEVLNI